jgi:putative transposase
VSATTALSVPVIPENSKFAILLLVWAIHVTRAFLTVLSPRGFRIMPPLARALIAFLATWFCSRLSLQLQIVALRHQLVVYQRSVSRPRLRPADHIFWSWLSRRWSRWREVLVFVKPATVIAWQHKRFRDHWTRISGKGTPGRPPISPDMRELIRRISAANPRWGSPRILGELRKPGIEVAKSTVEKYRLRHPTPPSPTWKAFLKNHVCELVSMDFLTVPTAGFRVLFVLVVLAHDRRQVIHFNVTENPTAHWTAQQIVEAFPWDSAPKYLLRDRDAIYGEPFRRRIESMGIEQALRPSQPMAESVRRTHDRQHPARLPGSRHCPDRTPPAAHPHPVLRLLQG